MTKEQLAQLTDDVRIPTELLLERLKELALSPQSAAISPDGGIAFFFETVKEPDLKLTADIEIYADGTISASVIPFIHTPDGYDTYVDESEPIDLWDVEEPPPFDETIRLIQNRLYPELA